MTGLYDKQDPDLPLDWEYPDWDVYDRVHGWRNYISLGVSELWNSFNEEQKKALARQASVEALSEDWE